MTNPFSLPSCIRNL